MTEWMEYTAVFKGGPQDGVSETRRWPMLHGLHALPPAAIMIPESDTESGRYALVGDGPPGEPMYEFAYAGTEPRGGRR